MKSVFVKHKPYFVLLAILVVAEFIVDPRGEFPLNDDWSYAKSVLNWYRDGNYDIGEWPAMTLFTHLAWGLLFTKVFGFSFFILRLSTLISSFIGSAILLSLLQKITNSKSVALTGTLVLLFNPIYFNLSNTYMTDVNFNTLFLLSIYAGYNFFTGKVWYNFILFFTCSLLLVFTRQFGILAPIAFTAACIFLPGRKRLFFVPALAATIIILLTLKYYENYLHTILPGRAAYKYTGDLNPLSKSFWQLLGTAFLKRHATVLLHILVYTLPFSLLFLKSLVNETKKGLLFFCASLSLIATHLVFYDEPFPNGNVFQNLNLGTETFYEYLSRDSQKPQEHTFIQSVEDALFWVKYLCISLNIFMLLMATLKVKNRGISLFANNPFRAFLILFSVFYTFMLLVTESFFDRYHIPLFTTGIFLLSFFTKYLTPHYALPVVLLIVFAYVSIFGTKDYVTMNAKRWEAYRYLKDSKKIPFEKINGGFEVNCWNEGNFCWWYLFMELKRYDYLIQYWQEPGFKHYKTYEFQRYFPYKKDKINIFVRDSIGAGPH